MVVVAAVLLVVAVASGVVLARTRAQVEALTGALEAARRDAAEAQTALRLADADRATARRERDDALEREKRARREAADVGRRLHQEHAARTAAEEAGARWEAELAEARAAAAARPEHDAGELWALALAGVVRTWDVSVAPSPGMPSPLEGADDQLRAAIEIEVDAAREEAGAAIDLEWSGDAIHAPEVSLRALSIAQELVARLAKASEAAVLRVTSDDDGVVIDVEGHDADGRSVVPVDVAAEHQAAPGRYVLGVGKRVTAGRRGT